MKLILISIILSLMVATTANAHIAPDKLGHIGIGITCSAMADTFTDNKWAIIGTAALCGVSKEGWDSFGYGVVEGWDVVATIAGGILYTYFTFKFTIHNGEWTRIK